MAVNMFLKLDTIAGESTNVNHKDEIEILSFSWGVSNSPTLGATGAAAGKAVPSDVSFVIRSGLASPPLFLACVQGRHLKQGLFVIENAAADSPNPADVYTLTLTDVLVSSYQSSGASDAPFDSFSLAFRSLRLKEIAESPTGAIGKSTEAGWDFAKNIKLA